jgi:hypothetical protein
MNARTAGENWRKPKESGARLRPRQTKQNEV